MDGRRRGWVPCTAPFYAAADPWRAAVENRDTDFGLADWKRFLSSPRSNMVMLNDRRVAKQPENRYFEMMRDY